MQLNNKTNGYSIKITNYDISSNTIKYNTINQRGDILLTKKHIYSTLRLIDYINKDTNYEDLCLDTLKLELGLDEYIKEEDTQNWLSINKDMRFIIPAQLVMDGLKEQNAFNDVMNSIIEDAKTDLDLLILTNDAFTAIYASSIASGNQSVIEPLIQDGTITVENKIV